MKLVSITRFFPILLFALNLLCSSLSASPFVTDCPSLLDVKLNETDKIKSLDLPKCYCDKATSVNKGDQFVQINCVHLRDDQELAKAAKAVAASNKILSEIHVQNLDLPSGKPEEFFSKLLHPSKQKAPTLNEITLKDCVGSTNNSFLLDKKAFKGLENSLKTLKIENCPGLKKNQALDLAKLFKSLDNLQLKRVDAQEYDNGDLDGFQNLKSLDLSGQRINIGANAFNKLKNLEILKLSGIGANSSIFEKLKPLANLKTLDLSANNIRDLPDKIFSGLKNLKTLILNFNYVPKLNDDTFSGLNQLQVLDLRVNLIQNVSANAFSKLANLKELLLAGNYVNDLDLKSMENANNLEHLDLGRNELRKLEKNLLNPLKKLRKLNLDQNRNLNDVETGALDKLQNLKNLNLSYTNLASFLEDKKNKDFFKPLNNLVSLDLSGLGMKKLDGKNLLNNLPKLANLFLKSNNLTSIEGPITPTFKNAKIFDLSDNPWSCDKNLKDLVAFLQKLNVDKKVESKFLSFGQAMCSFPAKLKGSPLSTVKIDNLL